MSWPNEHLSKRVKFVQAMTITAGATGTTDVEGTSIDMQLYNCTSICFVLMLGAITTGALTHLEIQQANDTGFTDGNEGITGTKQVIADDKDNTVFVSDIIRPQKRFVRAHFDRATQAAIGACIAILYGFKEVPVTQPTEVSGLEVFVDPVGGTP